MGLIFYLSGQSPSPYFAPLPYDKLIHFLEYALLGFFLIRAMRITFSHHNLAVLSVAAVVIAGIYGASDEFHQGFVPGRSPDMLDWAADSLGAAAAVLIISKRKIREKSA